MSILSIINNGGAKSDLSEARKRSLILILEALALNALDIGCDSVTDYQISLRSFAQRLEAAANPEEYILITGQIVQTLQLFCKNTESYAQSMRGEIQSMVDFLATSLVQVSKSSGQAATNLRGLEKRLEAVTALDDIREVRAQMKAAVGLIREEASRQESQYEAFRGSANEVRAAGTAGTTGTVGMAQPNPNIDEVTGLLSIREAETALGALTEGSGVYPTVFFLERLDMINGRYGFKVGDQILVLYSQFLAQHLRPTDKLYRWRGPSFVALLTRNGSADSIRAELKRISGSKLEHMVEVDSRKVLMTISSICALIVPDKDMPPGEIGRRVNTFVSAQSSRNLVTPDRHTQLSF